MKHVFLILTALCLLAAPAAKAQYTTDNPPQTLPKNENPYASLNPQTNSNPYAEMNRQQMEKEQAARKANDRMILNHASLGFTFGGGFGLELAAPLTSYGQLRGGYVFPGKLTLKYRKNWLLPGSGSIWTTELKKIYKKEIS